MLYQDKDSSKLHCCLLFFQPLLSCTKPAVLLQTLSQAWSGEPPQLGVALCTMGLACLLLMFMSVCVDQLALTVMVLQD